MVVHMCVRMALVGLMTENRAIHACVLMALVWMIWMIPL